MMAHSRSFFFVSFTSAYHSLRSAIRRHGWRTRFDCYHCDHHAVLLSDPRRHQKFVSLSRSSARGDVCRHWKGNIWPHWGVFGEHCNHCKSGTANEWSAVCYEMSSLFVFLYFRLVSSVRISSLLERICTTCVPECRFLCMGLFCCGVLS